LRSILPHLTATLDSPYTPGVKISIQNNEQHFLAHEAILSCRSAYFGSCLNGSWKEGQRLHICLNSDEATPSSIKDLLEYFYTDSVTDMNRRSAQDLVTLLILLDQLLLNTSKLSLLTQFFLAKQLSLSNCCTVFIWQKIIVPLYS